MLDWIDCSILRVPEVVIGVLWDEFEEGIGRREKFGTRAERGEMKQEGRRRWKVERFQKEDDDLWSTEWGYLVDLSMSA